MCVQTVRGHSGSAGIKVKASREVMEQEKSHCVTLGHGGRASSAQEQAGHISCRGRHVRANTKTSTEKPCLKPGRFPFVWYLVSVLGTIENNVRTGLAHQRSIAVKTETQDSVPPAWFWAREKPGSVWRRRDDHKEGLRNKLNKKWHLGCCCVVVRGPVLMIAWWRRGRQPRTHAVD